jgi:acetylornithine/succinyldiaminopimelate/putrescine aminotransferase
MLGIKFRKEYDVSFITHLSMNELLISIPASNNVLRLTPPLIITEKHCDEALKKLELVIQKLGNPTSKIKYKVKEGFRAFKRVVGVEKE